MEFASLIAEFGAHYGMDCLAPDENGAVGFEADGRLLAFQLLDEPDTVLASIELGSAPSAGAEKVNELLMRANQALFSLDGMALVIHPGNNRYRLLSRIDVAALDFAGFDEKIARILDRAEQWGAFLEGFAPLVAEAAGTGEASADLPETADPAGLSPVDLLRV